jgi:hypothetical protein
MTPEVMSASEPEPKGINPIARMFGVLFEPGKTFEDIAARPNFMVPMIVAMLLGCLTTALFTQRVGWERMMRQQMEMNQRSRDLPADQKEQAIQMYSRMGPMFGYGGSIIGLPLMFLILAGVSLGMAKGIMSAPISFKQAFAAVAYGWMPNIIAAILTIVVMFLKSPDDFRLDNPLVFNAGAFMDPLTSNKFIYSLASSFDLLWVWSLVLMGFGFKAAGGKKFSTGGAMAAVFVPWLVWVLGKSALAGLRG